MPDTGQIPGPRGPKGATGEAGKGLTKREKWFASIMLVLLVIGVAGCLLSQYLQQRSYEQGQAAAATASEQRQAAAAAAAKKSQEAQSALFLAKLCSSLKPLESLAGLKPPVGDPATNPSRAFEQQLVLKLAPLAQLGPDVGCK